MYWETRSTSGERVVGAQIHHSLLAVPSPNDVIPGLVQVVVADRVDGLVDVVTAPDPHRPPVSDHLAAARDLVYRPGCCPRWHNPPPSSQQSLVRSDQIVHGQA